MNPNTKQGSAGFNALLVVAIIVVVNVIVGGMGFLNSRFDLTEDKLYTLSKGTQNILDRLSPDEPVTIRFYASTDDRVMQHPMIKAQANSAKDLLIEFQKAAKGKIILETLAPNPKTEDEDKAREDDIQGVPINNEDRLYLGVAVQAANKKEVLPFLNPSEETLLEYNISRAIQKVSKEKKTVIGIMSAMPILGSPMSPFQRNQGPQPWVLIQRLRMDYEVREIQMSATSVDSDVNVLVIVHPADVTEQAEYAIDQYLMKGGNVLALVDPQSLVAQRVYSQQQNPMTGQPGNVINPASDLPNLFKAWGVTYNKADIVADMNYRSQLMGRQTPVALRLPSAALNKNDRITQNLQSLILMMSGAFDVVPKDGITATTLAASSEASDLIDNTTAEKLIREPATTFNAMGKKHTLAVMLKGKFKTAFPGGKPKAPAETPGGPGGPGGAGGFPGMPPGMSFPKPEGGGAQDDANAPKTSATPAPAAPAPAAATPAPAPAPAATAAPVTVTTTPVAAPAPAAAPAAATPATPAAPTATAPAVTVEAKKDEAKPAEPAKPTDGTILESENAEGVVVLFADADMMYDAFTVQQDPMTGGLIATEGNLPMFLNAVETLSGGGDLLQVRSRASTSRPFTKMDELREEVEKDFRPSIAQKQSELDKLAQEMGPLQVKNGQIMIDPAQIKKIKEMEAKQKQIQKEIREIEKDQKKQIDFTENIITLLNIFGVPLLVIAIGLTLAIRRRVTTAAV